MKKSLILFLAGMLMGTILVPMSVFAQQPRPINDSCKNAIIITPKASKTYTYAVYDAGGLETGSPNPSPCNPVGASRVKNDVWFKTTNISDGLLLFLKKDWANSGSPLIQIYTGSCGNLLYQTCFYHQSHNNADTVLTVLFNNPAGTNFYIRYCGFTANSRYVVPLWIAAVTLPSPKRIISKRLVGNWDSASSWVGNSVPSYNDTVVIDDGSTISVNPNHILNLAQITIGQQDTNLNARLVLQSGPVAFTAPQNLLINKKDTLDCNNLDLNIIGNFQLDGAIKAMFQGIPPGNTLVFKGKGNQVVSGKGRLAGDWNVTVSKNGNDTLFQQIPLDVRGTFFADSGMVVSSAPVIFHPGPNDLKYSIGSDGISKLRLGNGAIKNPNLQTAGYYGFANFKCSCPRDSVRNINRYLIPNTNIIYDHYHPLSTFSGNKVFAYNGSFSDSTFIRLNRNYFSFYVDGLLRSGPNDTLFFGQGNANLRADTLRDGYDVGTLFFQPSLVPKVTDTTFFPFYKFGAKRQVAVSATKKFKAGNQNLSVTVKAIPPTGSVIRPLAYMQGSFVFEINSNRDTLPADAVLRFMFTSKDNFTGSRNYLRIAQAPTPNGPWRSISPGIGNVKSNHVYTNRGITLQNGHYFAFGTVGPGRDLSFDWVQTTSPSLIGPGYPAHDLRIQIKNEGTVPALEAKVSWTINTPTPISGTSFISLNPPLAANASTVIGLNPADFIKVPYTGIFNYTITLDSNISNVFQSPYDTVKLLMDNRPHSLPFTQKYDTVKEWLLPLQYRSTPPNTNAWKWNSQNPCFYNENGMLAGYGDSQSLTEVLTEPLSLPAGNLYNSLDMQAEYSGFNANFQPSDSVVVSITLDSGKTYRSLYKLDSAEIAGRANIKTLYGQIIVPQPVRAHFRIKIYETDPHFSILTQVDNLRVSTTPLTVQQFINSGPIQIYPNPSANGAFRLKGVSEAVTVQIISLTGQILHSQNLNPDQEISLPELSAGVYLVKVSTREGNKVVRWVVER